jgi:hypothetical protein
VPRLYTRSAATIRDAPAKAGRHKRGVLQPRPMVDTKRIAISVVALCLLTISLRGQGNSLLAAFRQAGIAEAPGPIPVLYVESEKQRALGFQKSLQTARDWYEKQLNVSVPVVMTVLDTPTYDKFNLRNIPTGRAYPRSTATPGS